MNLPDPFDPRLGNGAGSLLAVAYIVLVFSIVAGIVIGFAALVAYVGPWTLLFIPALAIVVIACFARKLQV